jgi:uncharacterized SAM-binding protein YcdF (DUF218 family)
MRRLRLRRVAVWTGIVVLLLVGVFGVATARYLVWPQLRPVPTQADAIIELGGPGDRDSAALALAREGRAKFLIQSTVPVEAGTDKCLPPVPGVTVMCFSPDPGTTRGEAEYIGRVGRQFNWRSVIVVTSPDQAKRAELRVTRCFPGDVYLATTPLPTRDWVLQVPYQWAAFAKALFVETDC